MKNFSSVCIRILQIDGMAENTHTDTHTMLLFSFQTITDSRLLNFGNITSHSGSVSATDAVPHKWIS